MYTFSHGLRAPLYVHIYDLINGFDMKNDLEAQSREQLKYLS